MADTECPMENTAQCVALSDSSTKTRIFGREQRGLEGRHAKLGLLSAAVKRNKKLRGAQEQRGRGEDGGLRVGRCDTVVVSIAVVPHHPISHLQEKCFTVSEARSGARSGSSQKRGWV